MIRLTTTALALVLSSLAAAPAAAQAPAQVGQQERAGQERPLRDRLDRHEYGRRGPLERHRARKRAHGVRERLDQNDDGRVGRLERELARRKLERARQLRERSESRRDRGPESRSGPRRAPAQGRRGGCDEGCRGREAARPAAPRGRRA